MLAWTRFEQWFKHRFLRFLEYWMGKPPLDPGTIDWKSIEHIIVIRQHDQLGDLLLSTPVFRAIKEFKPQSRVTAVVRSYTQDLLSHHPYIDEVLVFHENLIQWSLKKGLYFWRFIRKGYDLAIVLNTVSHSLSSDIMAFLTRAPYILGTEHHIFTGCTRNFFYNLIAPVSSDLRHQSERNLDILEYVGIPSESLSEEIGITQDEISGANRLLPQLEYKNELQIGIHPGAGKMTNRWPTEFFARTADQLVESVNASIILFQGPGEAYLVDEVKELMHAECLIIPSIRLRELAAVMKSLDLFLCNDTGVMHVAASVGTPLVALFGPTDPEQWKPYGKNFIALQGDDGKVSYTKPDDVVIAAKKLLRK